MVGSPILQRRAYGEKRDIVRTELASQRQSGATTDQRDLIKKKEEEGILRGLTRSPMLWRVRTKDTSMAVSTTKVKSKFT